MSERNRLDQYERRRLAVQQFLAEHSTELAELYEWACQTVESRQPAGYIHLAAHTGRELMNRLADFLDVPLADPAAKRGRTGAEEVARQLQVALDSGDPQRVQAAAEAIVDDFHRGRRAIAARAEALVRAGQQQRIGQAEMTAWVDAWRRLQGVFAGMAHIGTPGARAPREPDLVAAWRELTALLAIRVAAEPFFHSLDELVDIAHVPEPDRALVRSALARLRGGTAVRFYAEISSPAWLDELIAVGAFSSVPEAVREGDWLTFTPWPEGQVLLRFARSAPEAVARACESLPATDNASVAEVVAETATLLPAELVANGPLPRRLAQDLRTSARLRRLPILVGQLGMRLAEAGFPAPALRLLVALLQVETDTRPSGAEILPDWTIGRFVNDAYLVVEAAEAMLPALLEADSLGTTKKLIRQLAGAQRRLATLDTTGWRQAIAGPDEVPDDDVRHLLLQLTRDAGAHIVEHQPHAIDELLKLLAGEDSELFRRLELHLLSRSDRAADFAPALLADPDALYDFHRLRETKELLRAAWVSLGQDEQTTVLGLIDKGPEPSRIAIDPEQDPDDAKRYRDEWRMELLGALDGLLDHEHQTDLDKLRGTQPAPDPAVTGGAWMGSISPLDVSGIAAMSSHELITYLQDFRAEHHFRAPSRQGLARELSTAISADGERFKFLLPALPDLRPVYVRACFEGFDAAVASGARAAVEELLASVEWVIAQPTDPERLPTADDDADLRPAQVAALRLLLRLLHGEHLDVTLRGRVAGIVGELAQHPDPTPERDAMTKDPMALAINCVRGDGAQVMLAYLGWLQRTGDLSSWQDDPEALELLNRWLDDPSRAVRTVFARDLAGLASVDALWTPQHFRCIVDPRGDERAQAGWKAYLVYGARVYGQVVSAISPAYFEAVEDLAGHAAPVDETRRHLADHVAVIWRDLPAHAPDLLDTYVQMAPSTDRARLIGTLGRALHEELPGDYEPDVDDLERHRALWEARLQDPGLQPDEAAEFGYWWTSRRFTAVEDAVRLARTLHVAGGRLGDIRDVVQVLAALVDQHEQLLPPALDALSAIADARTAQSQYIDAELLRGMLVAGLARIETRDRATALIHAFGEQGYLTLRALLD